MQDAKHLNNNIRYTIELQLDGMIYLVVDTQVTTGKIHMITSDILRAMSECNKLNLVDLANRITALERYAQAPQTSM